MLDPLEGVKTLESPSSIFPTAYTGALLEVWVAFQQKWIFLNKVLHEMEIQFPDAELVGKGVKEVGQELLSIRALNGRVELSIMFPLTYHLFLTTECPFQGHG